MLILCFRLASLLKKQVEFVKITLIFTYKRSKVKIKDEAGINN